jgi:hypothetical protein
MMHGVIWLANRRIRFDRSVWRESYALAGVYALKIGGTESATRAMHRELAVAGELWQLCHLLRIGYSSSTPKTRLDVAQGDVLLTRVAALGFDGVHGDVLDSDVTICAVRRTAGIPQVGLDRRYIKCH